MTTTAGRTLAHAPSLRATHALPVHPRRPGWRAGAAAALVAFATSELRAGRSPHRDVCSLAELGHGEMDRGVVAAEELDRRLAAAVASFADELLLRRAGSAVLDDPEAYVPLLDDEQADELVAPLFDHLGPEAVAGLPHPGHGVTSSVDVPPCAVHGDEADPVDRLRRAVRERLVRAVDGAAGASPHDHDPSGDPVPAVLWTGVAALAAWQAYAATR